MRKAPAAEIPGIEKSSVTEPDVFFNVQPVYTRAVDFFNPALGQGIIFYRDRKTEIIPLPNPVAAIFEVLGVQTVVKGIRTAPGTEGMG